MEFAGQESFSLQRGFELAEIEGISLQRKKIEPALKGGDKSAPIYLPRFALQSGMRAQEALLKDF